MRHPSGAGARVLGARPPQGQQAVPQDRRQRHDREDEEDQHLMDGPVD
jgi:hypothetical protein